MLSAHGGQNAPSIPPHIVKLWRFTQPEPLASSQVRSERTGRTDKHAVWLLSSPVCRALNASMETGSKDAIEMLKAS